MKQWKRRFVVGLLAGVVLSGGIAWRATPKAIEIGHGSQAQEDTVVRQLPPDAPVDPGRKGRTYYSLEGRTIRVTSRFDDGTTIVGERGPDGALHARVTDRGGNGLARLDAADTIRYASASGEALHVAAHPDVRLTLELVNRQAYALLKDGTSRLVWRGELMRSSNGNIEARVVEAEWPDGLVVITTRRDAVKDASADGRVFTGQALSARLTRSGQEIGAADYYPNAKLFRWSIPTLGTAGSIEAKHLEKYKGWPFSPTAEWITLQLLAFYEFKTLIDQKGFVASNLKGCGAPSTPSFARRLADAIAPRTYANEEGCDGLHWLDGTIYRYCCDIHDMCYAKYGCNSTTWWQFWRSWRCDACNAWAAWCFVAGPCLFGGGIFCP